MTAMSAHHIRFALAALALAFCAQSSPAFAQDRVPTTIRGVSIFTELPLAPEVSVTTFGVIRDHRCVKPKLCFDDNRLVVAAVITEGQRQREVSLELGVPYRLETGTVTLIGTSTPPSDAGAIRLSKYSLDFRFEPALGTR